MIMTVEKKIGRATCVARRITPSLVSSASGRLSRFLRIVSIITIAPSTRIPKSIAPNESRLAGISVTFIRIKATSSDSGIVKGHQQCTAPASEEQDQHQQHEQHPFEQRAGNGVQRGAYQIGTVHERVDRRHLRAARRRSARRPPCAHPSALPTGSVRAASARCPRHRPNSRAARR